MDTLIDKYGHLGNRLVFVWDGATWIKNWIENAFPKAVSILDFIMLVNICMHFQAAFLLIKQRKRCGPTNKRNGY